MVDRNQRACQWLDSRRRANMAHDVTYRRGQQSVVKPATVGQTQFPLAVGEGGEQWRSSAQQWQSRDFLFTAADLAALLGEGGEPQSGDRIEDGGEVFEVLAPSGEQVWRWSGYPGTTLRIHTRQIFLEGASG